MTVVRSAILLITMCGRYRLSRRKEFLAERFGTDPDDDWIPRYNIAPTQNVPVIRQHAEEPKRFGSRMRWGSSLLGRRTPATATSTPVPRPSRRNLLFGIRSRSGGALFRLTDFTNGRRTARRRRRSVSR